MSSPLAIAGVTAVLKDLLNDGLIGSDLAAQVKVTAKPPIRDPKEATNEESQLNLFLYHVSMNPGWRNSGLPSVDPAGERVGNPPLALDLHYLLTAYDARDLHAEALLGYALQLLHETPVLTRKAIRASLKTDLPGSTAAGSLPAHLLALTKTGLADQVESIKISSHTFGIEEMSKLWTSFQAPYRPSVAYLVTVVLIESTKPARSALPVLKVGADARGPVVQANLLAPFPTLLAVRADNYQPAARVGETVHLLGHHLTGTDTKAVFVHHGLNLQLEVPIGGLTISAAPTREELNDNTSGERFDVPDDVLKLADSHLEVNLGQAQPAAEWSAGVWSVFLSGTRPADSIVWTSNALPLGIAPSIRFDSGHEPQITAKPVEDQMRLTEVTLECEPKVLRGQQVSLIIGDRELVGAPDFAGTASETNTLKFKGDLPVAMFALVGVPPAPPKYPLRLRVAGVESLFIERFQTPKPPAFFANQLVTLPA